MTEVEAKFVVRRAAQIEDAFRLLEALGYRVIEDRRITQLDTYFDTGACSIHQAGWAYRCRECGEERTLMLKSAGKSGRTVFIREEIEQPLPQGFKPGNRKLPGGPVADRLAQISGAQKLRNLFTVETDRTVFAVCRKNDESVRFELDLDRTRITPKKSKPRGTEELAFTELELELKSGAARHVRELAARLVEQAHLLPAHNSKFERGLWAAGIRVDDGAICQDERRFHGRDSFIELLYWYLRQRLDALRYHQPIAWEGIHPEGVHKMRVAIRRTRAMLAAFGDILPQQAAADLNDKLRWLARQLGLARDADVCEMEIAAMSNSLSPVAATAMAPYAIFLRQGTVDAYARLAEEFGSERYDATVAALERFVEAGLTGGMARQSAELSITTASKRYVRPVLKKTLRRGNRIGRDSTPAELHKLRIRTKRLRYLLDLFSLGQPRKWQAAIASLEKLQDLLGEYQDAHTARRRLNDFAAALPSGEGKRQLWLEVGRLMQREDDRIASCRRRFPAAWSRFRKTVG